MFRHVVLLTLTSDASDEQREAIVDGLRGLPAVVGSIAGYQVGVDLELAADNATIAVVADFDDQSGYEEYRDHPLHRAVITEHIAPVLAARTASQFTV